MDVLVSQLPLLFDTAQDSYYATTLLVQACPQAAGQNVVDALFQAFESTARVLNQTSVQLQQTKLCHQVRNEGWECDGRVMVLEDRRECR